MVNNPAFHRCAKDRLVKDYHRFINRCRFLGNRNKGKLNIIQATAFIVISLLLCIVLFNSIIIVTQSLDEEKWVNRVTRTDFNVYNSAAFNVMESVQHHEDTLSQQAVDLIAGQPGVEDERYLYRNTKDDRNVLVDYGFEDLSGIELFHEEEGVVAQRWQKKKSHRTATILLCTLQRWL